MRTSKRRWGGWLSRPQLGVALFALPVALVSAACIGAIGDGNDGSGSGGGTTGPGGTSSSGSGGGGLTADGGSAATAAAGLHGLQRLTADELTNTVRDLLGLKATPALTLPPDGVNGSGFNAPGVMAEADARTILTATETLIGGLDAATWTSLLGCPPTTRDDACATAFIGRVGQAAYRRPLTSAESTNLTSTYQAAMTAGSSFADATSLVLEVMLNAPGFLYHTEGRSTPAKPDANGLVKLGGYELASRLSYFLTRSMPDAALFAAATSGGLDAPDGIATQAQRLLATPGARAMIGEFAAEWLGTDRVLSVGRQSQSFPTFTPALQASMAAETRAFFQNVVLDGDHTWTTLMTAPFSMIDANLASLYGVTGLTGTGLQKVALDPTKRQGFLTQAALLTVNSDPELESPIFRGKLIQTKLLCLSMGPPPKAFPPPSPPAGQVMTVRQMLEQVHSQPGCNSCHDVLDPPGFAFGGYDAIGRDQSSENGLPLDTTGKMTLPSGATLTFKGAHDLIEGLAGSDDAKACFTRQWYRFALQRKETTGETSSVQASQQAFGAAGLDVQKLMLSVVTSTPFRYRSVAPGEVTQ